MNQAIIENLKSARYKIIARLIKSNITVLINGEIGTGKIIS